MGLTYDALLPDLELLDGFVGPPWLQIAIDVELATLIVESVRDFVTDDHSDASVIEGARELRVVERWLQNSGR